MADATPLTDIEAHERLHAAWLALGRAPGATVHGNTALEAARRTLGILQIALLTASDKAEKAEVTGPGEP